VTLFNLPAVATKNTSDRTHPPVMTKCKACKKYNTLSISAKRTFQRTNIFFLVNTIWENMATDSFLYFPHSMIMYELYPNFVQPVNSILADTASPLKCSEFILHFF
jgi:hypothetical protein